MNAATLFEEVFPACRNYHDNTSVLSPPGMKTESSSAASSSILIFLSRENVRNLSRRVHNEADRRTLFANLGSTRVRLQRDACARRNSNESTSHAKTISSPLEVTPDERSFETPFVDKIKESLRFFYNFVWDLSRDIRGCNLCNGIVIRVSIGIRQIRRFKERVAASVFSLFRYFRRYNRRTADVITASIRKLGARNSRKTID